MTIKSVYIAAFGGLKDKTISFDKGFNVIYGSNENGKTTVMTFIKMMFFGSERGSSAISKNLRKKYSPWDGGAMAGSIDFEHSGRSYRLEREFKTSNSTDRLTLCDLDFGTRQAVASDVGVKFFGLSAAAFERSVFIGQAGGSEKDSAAEGEINSKLSNIVTTGDESVSFEAVYKNLEKARLSLKSKSGRAGELDKNIKQLSELNESLKNAETAKEQYQLLKEEAVRTKSQIAALQSRAAALKKQLESEKDVRNAEKLKEMLDLKQTLDGLNKTLSLSDGTVIDEMFVRKLVFCISKIDGASRKLDDKTAEADRLRESIKLAENPEPDVSPEKAEKLKGEITDAQKEYSLLQQETAETEKRYNKTERERLDSKNLRKKVNFPFILIAAFAFGVAAVMIALNPTAAAISAGVMVISLIIAFTVRPADKKKIAVIENEMTALKNQLSDAETKKQELESRISSAKARLEAINIALGSSTAMIERQKELFKECEEQISNINAEIQNESAALFTLYGHYKNTDSVDEIRKQLEDFSLKAANQKEIKQKLAYIAKDVGNISYDEARLKLEKMGAENAEPIDFEAVKNEYEALLKRLTESTARLASLNAQTDALVSSTENPEKIRTEIKRLTEKAKSQEEFCDAAETAMQTLTDSFAELRSSYGSVLEQKAGEIFAGLTSGRYKSMQISNSFDINVEQAGVFGGKELDFLSSGTADQAYLSLRLALAELISRDSEPLPVMLDDALTQYDDLRTQNAVSFLNAYSADTQVIMFTCHKSVSFAAKNAGAACSDF